MKNANLSQPKALYLLNFISMWECFSYYGMRALLILFMVHELNYSDENAFALYALYITLIEFGGVLGGIIADRWLGLKRCIAFGAATIALGHIFMAMPDSTLFFFLGLGAIVAGTAFFKSNVPAYLGEYYEENDLRRDPGYTLYYTGINIGGFLAAIACGIVGEVYGWHAGFGLAALGMLAGNIALLCGRKILNVNTSPKIGVKKPNLLAGLGLCLLVPAFALALYCYTYMTFVFPVVVIGVLAYILLQLKNSSNFQMSSLLKLGVYVLLLVLFYGCEEQLGSSLVLFSERHVDRETVFGILPAASIITFNPLTIILAGPILSKVLNKVPISGLTKIAISFCLLGSAFILLYFGSVQATLTGEVSLAYAIISILLIGLGEIFIGPTVYSYASEVSPKGFQGLFMGIVTIGYSLANLVSGFLSQMMSISENESSLEIYSSGFWLIGISTLLVAVVLFAVVNLFTQKENQVCLVENTIKVNL